MHDFKQLSVWQNAMDLVLMTYRLTAKFPDTEKFGLVSQMNRAAVSIASNIAEGAGRKGNGEFKLFLGYASGSSYELETQGTISHRLGYISNEEFEHYQAALHSVQKQTYNLLKSIKT